MRAVREIEIPAGAKVALKPGGLHVMLLDLKQPLVSGDRVPLTLTFARAGKVEVTVNVEPMVPVSDAAHQH
jgi:copper(I)-binding protein